MHEPIAIEALAPKRFGCASFVALSFGKPGPLWCVDRRFRIPRCRENRFDMPIKSLTKSFGCIVIAALLLHAATAQSQDAAAEVRVKAAIVHKIAKFVTWPESRFATDDESLRFCVLGNAEVVDAFEALRKRPIHGRLLRIQNAPDPDDVAEACDVLYLAQDEHRTASEWFDAVAGHPVLTFAEEGGYGGEGSIVAMAIRRNKVRFSINLKANENSKLRIGAQLLQLAAAVGTPGHAS